MRDPSEWRLDRASNVPGNGRGARGLANKSPQVEAKIKDRHDKVLSDETTARLAHLRHPGFSTAVHERGSDLPAKCWIY